MHPVISTKNPEEPCLLTKQKPSSALDRVLEDDLIPPKRLNPKISDRVNAAILQGLAVRPQDRPQTVQAWLSLLPDVGWQVSPAQPQPVQPRSPSAPAAMVNLRSQTSGVDYTKLRDLLKAQKWKEADKETYVRMLEVVGRKDGDYLRLKEIEEFPCEDLRIIDQLWVKYNNGQFGFSVQKKIWQKCGSPTSGHIDDWKKFGDRVGWRVKGDWLSYYNLNFSLPAPTGHLPSGHLPWGGGGLGVWWPRIFSRAQTCKL